MGVGLPTGKTKRGVAVEYIRSDPTTFLARLGGVSIGTLKKKFGVWEIRLFYNNEVPSTSYNPLSASRARWPKEIRRAKELLEDAFWATYVRALRRFADEDARAVWAAENSKW
jgi:hypothetical protein